MGTFFTLLEWKESFFSFELSIAHGGAVRVDRLALSRLCPIVCVAGGKSLISISPSSHKNYYYDESRNLIVVENMSFFLTLLNSLRFQAIRKISIQAIFRDELSAGRIVCTLTCVCVRESKQECRNKMFTMWNIPTIG